MIEHVVQQGECLLSIAEQYGFLWEKLWNHADNEALKDLRKDPNVLLPGDVVFVPNAELCEYSKPTEASHTFVRVVNVTQVRLQLLDYEHRPRASVRYKATLDDVETRRGSTDGNGYLTIPARPKSQRLRIEVTESDETDTYDFQLGHIDPIDTMTGVRQRLTNLGYSCAPDGDEIDDQLARCLKEFQRDYDFEQTGALTTETRDKLSILHGC